MENLSIEYIYQENLKRPLTTLYFCRHCMKLRSIECVYQHNNSNFCPNCLVNVTASEAKVLQNRCLSCIICPSCFASMHTKAFVKKDTLNESQDLDEKSTAGFYFKCPVCKWSTKEGDLPLIETTNTSWPLRKSPTQQEYLKYVEYFKNLSLYENQEIEERKKTNRRSFAMDRLKNKKSVNHKYNAGLSIPSYEIGDSNRIMGKYTMPVSISAEATDEIEALPDHIFNAPLDIQYVTSIEQRISDPEFQPATFNKLYPIHMPLFMKCFQRCKECDYTIVKSEYNPSTTKFKVQHFAILYVPNITIYEIADLHYDEETVLVLTISNPYMHSISVLLENCEEFQNWSTATVELPKSELQITNTMNNDTFDDDIKEIAGRYKNKLRFYVKVKPQNIEGDVKIQFALRFDMEQTDLKDTMKSMSFCVCLNLGHVK